MSSETIKPKLSLLERRIEYILWMLSEHERMWSSGTKEPVRWPTSKDIIPRANRCKIFRQSPPMDTINLMLSLGLIYRTRESDTDAYRYGIAVSQDNNHEVMDE